MATPSSPTQKANRTQKSFIPLENNPQVMTTLLQKIGLSPALEFHDVYSITDPDLLAIVPRPAHALLLVFPVSQTYETFRQKEDSSHQEYSAHGPGEEVVWYKQTIGNACGLIGLLHSASNGEARGHVAKESELDKFIQAAVPLAPKERAELVEDSDMLATAHAAAAQTGDTAAPDAEAGVDLHYVAFVKSKEGNLWELDGRRKGPLNRGKLEEGDDVLSPMALEKGVQAFLKREEEAGGGDLRFSLIALAEAMD